MLAGGKPLRFILACACIIKVSQAFFLDSLPDPKIPELILDPLEKIVFRNKCLEDLGCFFTGPPFYNPILRPISLAPFDLDDMHTKFLLFTPSNDGNGTLIEANKESLENSGFEKDLPLKIISHGFLTIPEPGDDRYQMKDALLKEGKYNVIIVDWSKANQNPYMQAVANARVVGAQIAQLVNFLMKERGINPKDVHLIGHSLGAHISGFAGKRIKGLGRISGLDPAGPYFRYGEPEIRLYIEDAVFVDIIHADVGDVVFEGLGIKEALGDQDFYPNGGAQQPGCEPTLLNFTIAGINVTAVGSGNDLFTGLLATSCNHNRPYKFYTASIDDSKCKFMATQCENYEMYEKGECNNNVKLEMGFHAKPDPQIPVEQKYYLKTSAESPFCIPQQNQNETDNSNDENK